MAGDVTGRSIDARASSLKFAQSSLKIEITLDAKIQGA
jgi:hypothetical protein